MIYFVSASSSVLIAVSYLALGLLVVPKLSLSRLAKYLATTLLILAGVRMLLAAVLVLFQGVILAEGGIQYVASWVLVSFSVTHALLAMGLAVYGVYVMQPWGEREDEADARDKTADERESDADRRETKADARQGSADWREGVADHREGEADQRERDADQRERDADKREHEE